ncbi:hypothetical protein [Actinomadura sp. SCN-SB]|uniref:hypothetical protein n=1 Tax=Actinomadura sp. SCN-SB TaxID=3373092 RepID=UPI0037518AEE
MLADASPVGANILLAVAPLVVALALVTWLFLTLYVSRRRVRTDRIRGESPHRGAVQGGVIEGSPAQRTRRDEAPHDTDR